MGRRVPHFTQLRPNRDRAMLETSRATTLRVTQRPKRGADERAQAAETDEALALRAPARRARGAGPRHHAHRKPPTGPSPPRRGAAFKACCPRPAVRSASALPAFLASASPPPSTRSARFLTAQGHKVAVQAVDPSSTRTGGSILGDKTRMQRLAMDPRRLCAPLPLRRHARGIAAKTRETMLLCEAAGFDVVLVETVGVGQSETAWPISPDTFLVLMLPGAGDELQGIKKGVLELADIVAVNKADGDNLARARAAAGEYKAALHLLGARDAHWSPPVLTYSGLTGAGIPELWEQVRTHRARCEAAGAFAATRRAQQVRWMWTLLQERLAERVRTDAAIKARLPALESAVADGTLAPTLAANEIAALLGCEVMRTVLITGIGPFPGMPRNPTAALALRLARLRLPALAGLRREPLILRPNGGRSTS